jgi:hypothetical protein
LSNRSIGNICDASKMNNKAAKSSMYIAWKAIAVELLSYVSREINPITAVYARKTGMPRLNI